MTLLDQTQDVRSSFKSADYFALNAQLNQWVTDADGNKVIPFEKDKEAARVYMIDHVNANMWWHHDLEEKLRFLVDNEYWEKEFLEKYDPAFVKKLFQHAYSKKFRFPTFMSAYKFYSAYALKSFDGKRYLERYEDRVAAVALYMANGNKKFAMEIVDVAIGSLFQVATPTFMNAGKKQRGELVSCFEAGTPILTESGSVAIERLSVGDMVMTHDGSFAPITTVGSRFETQALHTVRMSGNPLLLTATPEHPVLIQRGAKNLDITSVHEGDGASTNLIWARMDQILPGDMVTVARNLAPALKEELSLLEYINETEFAWERQYVATGAGKLQLGSINAKNNRAKGSAVSLQNSSLNESVKLDYDFGRFVGYYLAEGYVHKTNGAIKGPRFTFGSHETGFINDTIELGERLFGVKATVNQNKDNSTNVAFWSAGLGAFLINTIGTGFDRKLLPDYMVQAPNGFLYGLLVGAARGDGCTTSSGLVVDMSNPAMMEQLRDAALRIGLLPYLRNYNSQSGRATSSLRISAVSPENVAFIYEVNKNIAKFVEPKKYRDVHIRWVDGQAMYRVKSVSSQLLDAPVEVFNLEVEDKHTYVANGYVVHNCFLLNVDDDLNSIFRGINSAAQLSKRGGGVAFCLTNVRGKGDPIKQIENSAGGILPWMKIFEKTFDAVDQLGTRAGAGAVYLNAHHIDILDFLDSKRENADENVRIKTLSMGVVIPDITFELARNGEEMYLFSPYDIAKEYGQEMAWISVTEQYRAMVDNPRIHKEKVPGGARRFLTMLAEVQMESGYPYVLFEDAANRANPVGGKIIMSNLCSEILQPSEPSKINDDLTYEVMGKDISCNLGSFNMLKLVESGTFGKHVETAVRMLTFVSDASNIEAVPTVAAGNRRSHAIGIGAMNLHGMFGHFEIEYGDEESIDLTSAYFQTLTYHAIKASNTIARERKETFDGFEKSKYATGEYFDRYTTDSAQALLAVKTDKVRAIFAANNIEIPTLANWEALRESVKKHGLYNQNLQAVAPTGSISYIANATPSLLPITSRAETRKEGKLKAIFMAPEMNMHNISYFKTAYEIPAAHVIDIYSVAEYFIDQSASLTLHMPAKSGPKQINQAQLYSYSKGKPSTKARDERGQMLDRYPQAEVKTIYYYRIEADVLEGTNADTVASADFLECVSCAL